MTVSVVISGVGLEMPGLPAPEALLDRTEPLVPDEFKPYTVLGRKGLLSKDRATRLGMCAALAALKNAGLATSASEQREPDALGVAVSSNLGNLDTVCKVVDTIHAGHVRDTSVLDAPNASSNIIASSVAIRFGCRGVNLMVCSGGGSGIDAMALAANTIRAGRAKRMLVVGVETCNDVALKLMGASVRAWLGQKATLTLADGAAAVLLESAASASARGARVRGRVAGYGAASGADIERSVAKALAGQSAVPSLWLIPNRNYPQVAKAIGEVFGRWGERGPECLDLGAITGETYGLLGVLQCVAAALWLERRGGGLALATSGAFADDGTSSLSVEGAT